jgi:hypothetical protein
MDCPPPEPAVSAVTASTGQKINPQSAFDLLKYRRF